MTDTALTAALVKSTLMDIARQTSALGTALQNAAPGAMTPNNSVQYLLDTSENLSQIADDCHKAFPGA